LVLLLGKYDAGLGSGSAPSEDGNRASSDGAQIERELSIRQPEHLLREYCLELQQGHSGDSLGPAPSKTSANTSSSDRSLFPYDIEYFFAADEPLPAKKKTEPVKETATETRMHGAEVEARPRHSPESHSPILQHWSRLIRAQPSYIRKTLREDSRETRRSQALSIQIRPPHQPPCQVHARLSGPPIQRHLVVEGKRTKPHVSALTSLSVSSLHKGLDHGVTGLELLPALPTWGFIATMISW